MGKGKKLKVNDNTWAKINLMCLVVFAFVCVCVSTIWWIQNKYYLTFSCVF